MQEQDAQLVSPPALSSWPRRLGMAAVAAAFVLAVLLGVRRIGELDVGYHLAYGEHFLQTGHIVQTNEFIYTRFDPTILADPANLGPGNTYDPATNTYRFVNANWLSQVVMALAYRGGGVNGLIVLQAALVAGIFALLLVALRQAGAGWPATAAAMLLAALVSYERFNLRPELFGYVILLGQWLLLSRRQFRLRHAVGVILLQAVLVNLHSYFLPSIALAGAMLTDQLLRLGWDRWVTQKPIPPERMRQAKWLAVAVAGMVVACLVNPWTWRGAIFPIQTLAYLKKHHILGQEASSGPVHPWAAVGEMFSPFTRGSARLLSSEAYFAMLGLAGVAVLVGLLRRRWGLLLAMGGMLSVSLNVRRNIAFSAIIVIPCAVAIGHEAWQWAAAWLLQRRARTRPKPKPGQRPQETLPDKPLWPAWLPGAVSAALLAAGLGLSVWTVTNGLYFHERQIWRFDTGWARMTLPVSAAEWISRNNPAGRVFSDLESSSNLLFLTQPHRDMPALTNTWAYPPYVMGMVLVITMGKLDLDSQAAALGDVQTVVLCNNNMDKPLIRRLADSKDWAVVDLDATEVIFLRRAGPNAALAAAAEILPGSLDIDRFAAKAGSADPVPAFALHNAALLMRRLGWEDAAIALWERSMAQRADYAEPRNMLGVTLTERGGQALERAQAAYAAGKAAQGERLKAQGRQDWQRAEELFLEALRLKSDQAGENLSRLQSGMANMGFRRSRMAGPGQE